MMEKFEWKYDTINFSGTKWIPQQFSTVIVLVHGIGEHIERYNDVADFFAKNDFAVTGIDHYGHGRSDGARGSTKGYEFYFNYIAAFIEYVKHTCQKPVVLYGHSMGGGIVTAFVLKRHPDIEAVIISSPAFLLSTQTPPLLMLLLSLLNKIAPSFRIKQGLDINKISHDKKQVETFINDPLRHERISIRLAYDMIKNGEWCIKHARDLQIPALLIHGDHDAFTNVEGSRTFAKNAPQELLTYKEWKGGYHELHNEPERMQVLQFILEWLHQL